MQDTPPMGNRIAGLEELLRAAAARSPAPVERWTPPYCGDIGLAIAADGTWSYRGSPIRRAKLVALFARVLVREDDGRFYVVTPAEKVDVRVADAPFLAVEMEARGRGRDQEIMFRTNVDDVVRVDERHPLTFGGGQAGAFKPYVRVRGGLDALLTRPLAQDLVALADEGPDGALGVWSAGVWWQFSA